MLKRIKILIIACFCLSLPVRAEDLSLRYLEQKQTVQACLEYVLQNTGYEAEKLILNLRSCLPEVSLPQGKLSFAVSGEVKEQVPSRLALRVEVKVDQHTVTVLYPVFDLDLNTGVLVTSCWVKRGQIFSSANVREKEMPLSDLPPRAVTDFAQIEGMLAKVSLPKDRVICLHHSKKIPLVEKKQPVKIICYSPGLRLEARGMALSEGSAGEVIRVRNMDSKKVIYAEVMDKGLVSVKVP